APQVLADAPTPRGGTWSSAGVIVFAPLAGGGRLLQVPGTGGPTTPVTTVGVGQNSHRWPQFLPDGRHFLFLMALGRPDTRGTYIGSLDGGNVTRVLPDALSAVFAPPDRLLVVRQGALMALRFDPTTRVMTGEPQVIA